MSHAHCHPFPFLFMSRGRDRCGPTPFHDGPPPWILELIGSRGRPERGEVRWMVLEALESGSKHGYAIIQAIEERSKGAYKPSPGSVYPTLQMLEELEQVSVTEEGARKSYTLTEAGRVELEAHREEVQNSYARMGQETDWTEAFDFHDLGRRFRETLHAIRRGVHRGRVGGAEIRRIKAVFDRALDEVEAILAGKKPE